MITLLSAKLSRQLQAYSIQSGKLKRSWQKGSRKSSRFGSSHDFSDYRVYQPGDDLRQVDWNIYARTNKHYIKRYLDEQELSVTIYLDCTKSMSLLPKKWELAKQLTASIAYIGLCNDDRISIIPVHSEDAPYLYRKGKSYLYEMVRVVENIKPKETTALFSEEVAQTIQRKSSISIVITDLMEPISSVELTLKKIQANRQQVLLLHLVDKEELEPTFTGDFLLEDSETKQGVNVTVTDYTRKSYITKMNNRIEYMKSFCFERGISYLLCSSSERIEDILFKRMTSQGWIR